MIFTVHVATKSNKNEIKITLQFFSCSNDKLQSHAKNAALLNVCLIFLANEIKKDWKRTKLTYQVDRLTLFFKPNQFLYKGRQEKTKTRGQEDVFSCFWKFWIKKISYSKKKISPSIFLAFNFLKTLRKNSFHKCKSCNHVLLARRINTFLV